MRAGLVARSPHPTDGRQVLFALTEAGARRRHALRHAKRNWLAEAIDGELDEEEQRTLAAAVELMGRLAKW